MLIMMKQVSDTCSTPFLYEPVFFLLVGEGWLERIVGYTYSYLQIKLDGFEAHFRLLSFLKEKEKSSVLRTIAIFQEESTVCLCAYLCTHPLYQTGKCLLFMKNHVTLVQDLFLITIYGTCAFTTSVMHFF